MMNVKVSCVQGYDEDKVAIVMDDPDMSECPVIISKHIIKQGSTDRCRMCHTQVETMEHIISGCQTLAADKYLNRHNQVAAQLHLDICKHYAIKVDAQHWYQHNPE